MSDFTSNTYTLKHKILNFSQKIKKSFQIGTKIFD
jgi:hypothetical protein